MFTQDERAEIRILFYNELVNIHEQLMRAGSYHYLCLIGGRTVYTHDPIGKVVWHRPWL